MPKLARSRASHSAGCFVLLFAASWGAGCRGDNAAAAQASANAKSPLVARVGSGELREDDVRRAIEREPTARARTVQPAARRDFIDGLVRFELLAQAADKAGFTQDPDALHALKQIAVSKFVNAAMASVPAPEAIPRADVERAYAARQATEYTRPEAVRLRHTRVADAALAARLVAKARALAATDDEGFAALARSTSEDAATRTSGGDLGFVDDNARQLPRSLIEAGLALRAPGQVSEPLATPQGYEILRLVSRRSAVVTALGDVEDAIRQRLYRERRSKALEDLLGRLRSATPVEIVNPSTASP